MPKGYFKILVLKELKSSEKTGYDLIKSMSAILGREPSAGSIYPLLNDLLGEKLISFKEEGRKKVYSITKKGDLYLKELFKEKKDMMLRHAELMKVFNDCGAKGLSNKDYLRANKILLKNLDVFLELKGTILELVLSKDFSEKEEKVRKIVKQTAKQLKGL